MHKQNLGYTQESIADKNTKKINTEVYDLRCDIRSYTVEKVDKIGNFVSYISHKPISTEKIDIRNINDRAGSINDEPVDNTGLSQSYFGGGYYYLGEYGGYYYAPEVYAQLHRKCDYTYDGETSTWKWDAGTTIGAISAYISMFGGPVSAIIGLLFFTAEGLLSYMQAIKLATYTFNYSYVVTVNYKSYFTTARNITYWKIENITENTEKWIEKNFNYGFSMANTEMVKAGIDNYLAQK